MTLLALTACNPASMPGTELGTFQVQATTQTNTCGLGAPDPWQFNVQLSEQGTTLYWSFTDGSPYLSGTLNAQSQATIADQTEGNVDGTDASLGPCTMTRNDTLTLTLGSGSAPASFSGSIIYAFAVPAGSDCSDQLASSGGTYNELPCTITYTMTGTKN